MINEIKENWFKIFTIIILLSLVCIFYQAKVQQNAEFELEQEKFKLEKQKQQTEDLLNVRKENRIDEEKQKLEEYYREQIRLEQEQFDKEMKAFAEKEQREYDERQKNREELSGCLSNARISAKTVWNSWCKSIGRKNDCILTSYYVTKYNNIIQQQNDFCFKRYNR